MVRTTKEQMETAAKATALQDIHQTAAEAMVNRDHKLVEGLESLCDSYMKRFAARQEPEDKLRTVMDALGLDDEAAIKILALHADGCG